MSYVGLTHDEEQRMLRDIGVTSFDDLVAAVPADAQYVPAGHLAAIAECWMTVFHRGTIIWEA